MGIIKQLTLLDETTGEVISRSERRGTPLGKEWVAMYKEHLLRLADECPTLTSIRVFLMISAMQKYDGPVTVTKAEIARRLKTSRQNVYKAIAWLESHDYLREISYNGLRAFALNPDVTVFGKDLASKTRLYRGEEGQIKRTPNRGPVRRKSLVFSDDEDLD